MRSKNNTTSVDHAAALYNQYIAELSTIGTSEFQMTPAEAGQLAHEVLMVSITSLPRIQDMRAWLTASMRSAAAKAQRDRAKV
ncbi:MAG TPA: hypothetical protein VEO54_11745 [Thermoanaerobaculia bacterium]|nr:hypothetical protein [Thermoanaerobaculia bacterium]